MSLSVNIIGGPVQLSGNPVYIEVSNDSPPAGILQYKSLLKILSQDGNLVGAPFVDAIASGGTHSALFDISGYVDQPISVSFQYPLTSAYSFYPRQAFNIQVIPGEQYIDVASGELIENWGVASSVFQMLKGGVS